MSPWTQPLRWRKARPSRRAVARLAHSDAPITGSYIVAVEVKPLPACLACFSRLRGTAERMMEQFRSSKPWKGTRYSGLPEYECRYDRILASFSSMDRPSCRESTLTARSWFWLDLREGPSGVLGGLGGIIPATALPARGGASSTSVAL